MVATRAPKKPETATKPKTTAKAAAPKKSTPKKTAAKKTAPKKTAPKKTAPKPPPAAAKKPRVFAMSFASVYPLYVTKVERKGRTRAELDEVIAWLTGYAGKKLQKAIDTKVDFEAFFDQAPRMNPNVGLITGTVCGIRVEEVEDPLMQKIRWLDKLVDELANGKKMESILRG